MFKYLEFFIKNIIRIIIQAIISLIPRDNHLVILGLRTPKFLENGGKDYFMHNTKYIFLKYANSSDVKFIYLCDNKPMKNAFLTHGFKNVFNRNSLKGLYYTIRAKYWLYDDSKYGVNNPYLSGGATCINLWHGVPLKKIVFDTNDSYQRRTKMLKKMQNLLRDKDSFYNVNSEYEQSCYETAFLTSKDKIKILGSPRLDVLLHEIPHADLFMEEDFAQIKSFKEQGKKLFFYTPTFRDTGKDISGWLKSDKLKKFLHDNNAVLVCKLHFADKNSFDLDLPKEFYKMDSDSDIYPVLKYSDALITDYSSIYFDYLLLDKPILYYPIDLEEYQEKCRGFYRPYEDLTAGVKAYNEDELVSAMNDVINEVDNYKEKRKLLRDKMFKYQDGKNCERVVEWVRSLDK